MGKLHGMPPDDEMDRARPDVRDVLLDATPALLSYIDRDLRYRYVNRAYETWFGVSSDDIVGKQVCDVLGEEAWERVRGYTERVLAGETVTYDDELPFALGGTRYVRVTYTPDRDATGVCGYSVLANDITERVKSERLMAQSQRMAQVGSWVLDLRALDDLNSNALRWSDQTYAIFGYEPGSVEVTNELFFEAVHPDDRVPIQEAVARALRDHTRYEIENRIRRPDGEERIVHQWGEIVFDSLGNPREMLGTCQDVTEHRLAQRRALEAAEERARAERDLLAMLAHELRNPLAPVLTAVEILERIDVPDRAVADQREVIARQVTHMRRLLDDLLDVARIERGKIELKKERLDATAAILQAVEVSRPLIASKGHELTLSLPGKPLYVDADPTRLTQVLANILNNAAKYTPAQGHIALEASQGDGCLVVRVRDDGVGMPRDVLEHVFDLFVQSSRSLARSEGGLGIGLTLVRSLVEMHGGDVRASSDGPGRGTEIVVRLPLAAPVAPKQAATPKRRGRSYGLRVLVIDDNVDFAESMAALLRLLGNDADTAHDGLRGLEAATAGGYDLVLVDIGLPEIDGYEVARRLRATRTFGARLVAISGYGQEQDVRAAREAGFDRHLTKPVSVAEIEPVLAEVKPRPRATA